MIRVTEININLLEKLAGMYMHCNFIFNTDPASASSRRQKKIRRWLTRTYKERLMEFPQNIAQHFSSEISDQDVLSFLKECYQQIELIAENESQQFEETVKNFSDDAKDALRTLLQLLQDGAFTFSYRDHELAIIIDDCAAFRRILLLKNAEGIPTDMDFLSLSHVTFTKTEKGYCIQGEPFDYSADRSTNTLSLFFTDVQVEVTVCRACNSVFLESPWNYLGSIAASICEKSCLPGCPCNEQELALLPLLTEIANMEYRSALPEQLSGFDFSNMISLIKEYGYHKLISLFASLKDETRSTGKYDYFLRKIISTLNEQCYEPLWRNIFNRILASQAEYPEKTEIFAPADVRNNIRTTIQKVLEQHGFSGTYPDFIREGPLRGIHLEESYRQTYFVGVKKHAIYHIHCIEEQFDDQITIEFLCGTAVLRKKETADDIYSCLFQNKGHRLFHTVSCNVSLTKTEKKFKTDDLELCTRIAVKKAELQPLSKEEKEQYYGNESMGTEMLFLIFFFMGGMFSLFMTTGFILIELLVSLLAGQMKSFPELFLATPWWILILFCWIAFGGLMTLVTFFVKNKL